MEKEKRCCTFHNKCINYDKLTCKSKRKPKCWVNKKCKYYGPYIKRKCTLKCHNIPVGKHGRRKRCCKECTSCHSFRFTETPKKRPDACQKRVTKCIWKGHVYIVRKHHKCSIKPFGLNKERKRCCNWEIKCVGKHCKVVHRRCSWTGCIVSFWKRSHCRIRMKNDHQKQKYCCKWNKKCCGAKCRNYNHKCKYIGKIITTRHHWKCQNVKIGKYGTKKRCCRHKKSLRWKRMYYKESKMPMERMS